MLEQAVMINVKEKLSIQEVRFKGLDEMEEFAHDIRRFMGKFKDSKSETMEALEIALEDGFVLEAQNEDKRAGVVVLTRTPFSEFQPKYHLAYIAVDSSVRGIGLGRKLLDKALEVTDGSIALHVGPGNRQAVGFYEKLGWEVTYLRMMPASD